MYLMYTPLGDDTIPVPLVVVVVDWHWQFAATLRADGSWILDETRASHSTNPPATETYDFPEWEGNIGWFLSQPGDLGEPVPG